MLLNNIKVSFRNLRKNKTLSGIQIFGLAVDIASATLLYLTAMYEFSFNDFHKDKDRIGLLYLKSQPEKGVEYASSMPAPIAPLLKSELADVELASRYYNGSVVLRHKDKQFQSNNKYVDPDFLSIFSFPMLYGNKQALQDLDNIVIDESMARNLFGTTDVVGNQVEVFTQDIGETKSSVQF